MRGFILLMVIAVFTLGTLTLGCAKQPEKIHKRPADEQNYLTIATGDVSGPYFTIGKAVAKVYKTKLGYNTAVRSTDGSVENVNLLASHTADLAFVMSDTASFELEKSKDERSKEPPFKAVAGLYFNFVQIVTLRDENIQSVYDLKGKRVGVGAPNSGVEMNARMILREHSISYQDIQPEYLSYAEAMEQLKNNQIDAAFVTSGLPNPAVLELQQSKEVAIVTIDTKMIDHLTKQYPYFEKAELPAGVYQNKQPIPTVAIRNILLVRSDLSDDQVYKMTQTFFENLNTVQQAHQAANYINRNGAGKDLAVPLHPGAMKYFKDSGIQ